MRKYYELTVRLTEKGWKKQIKSFAIIEMFGDAVCYKNPKWGNLVNKNLNKIHGNMNEFWVGTLDKSKLNIYYEQAKDLIIKDITEERNRLNGLLQVAVSYVSEKGEEE